MYVSWFLLIALDTFFVPLNHLSFCVFSVCMFCFFFLSTFTFTDLSVRDSLFLTLFDCFFFFFFLTIQWSDHMWPLLGWLTLLLKLPTTIHILNPIKLNYLFPKYFYKNITHIFHMLFFFSFSFAFLCAFSSQQNNIF